jgi:hypothetical protein
LLSIPYEDPPLGGYFGGPSSRADTLSGYFDGIDYSLGASGDLPAVISENGDQFNFRDAPCISTDPGNPKVHKLVFDTYLAGVDSELNLDVFVGANTAFRWSWTSGTGPGCGAISALKFVNPAAEKSNAGGSAEFLRFLSSEDISANDLAFFEGLGVDVVAFEQQPGAAVEPPVLPLLGLGLFGLVAARGRVKRRPQA